MVAFDFTQDKITLNRTGLFSNNTQGSFVRDVKTNPVITAYCNSCDCNSTSGTPLGLSDVFKVILNKKIDKRMQYSTTTMDKGLSKEAKDYGAFDAYVIWSIRHAVDQRLRALEVPPSRRI